MPDHAAVYARQAELYEDLVAHEDYQQQLLPALLAAHALGGLDVVELGAGTGRVTALLAPLVGSLTAFDLSVHMLGAARLKLEGCGKAGMRLAAADHRAIPLPACSADVIISGWSVCYLYTWYKETFRVELAAAMDEMRRVLRPGGWVLLIESLGTGETSPIYIPHLGEYYLWLEENGFRYNWVRTDYCFDSMQQARQLTTFFFGGEMCERIQPGVHPILPECTGVWYQTT